MRRVKQEQAVQLVQTDWKFHKIYFLLNDLMHYDFYFDLKKRFDKNSALILNKHSI